MGKQTPTDRRKRHGTQMWFNIMFVVAFLALTGLVTYSFVRVIDEGATQGQFQRVEGTQAHLLGKVQAVEDAQTRQLLNGCRRLNILIRQDNSSNYADYRFITQQIKFTSRSLRSNYLALKHLGLPRRVLRRALRQSIAGLRSQRAQARAKKWTPPTDCQAAVNARGSAYRVTSPVSFAKRLPPRSALLSPPS